MKKYVLSLMALLCTIVCHSQNTLYITVKDAKSKEALTGATVLLKGTTNGSAADANGLVVIKNLPVGKQVIVSSFIGYTEHEDTITIPTSDTLIVLLEEEAQETEEVVISTTRSTRTISDIPTRVEFVAGEELDEKANMKPGDIRMVLSESTGIQVQQTSATTANSVITMQGLDGRYTQILKDGFPLYAGFSGGLGLLQTPP